MLRWDYSDSRLTAYATYDDYLKSELWKEIRCRVFDNRGRRCWTCTKKAAVCVHHTDYVEKTMTGDDIGGLYPMCKHCHEKIHRSRSLLKANNRLYGLHAEAYPPVKTKKGQKRNKRLARALARMSRDRRFHEKAAANWR